MGEHPSSAPSLRSRKKYVCEDRTARRLNGRFDISCDKDKNCPYEVAGWTRVEVLFE